ncbi:MAG: lipoyl(octanoyl) transferase LipB [Anaerolineales bacterium]|nr:MAG: lipoyl(octanoyl) transferase LipB [Anaerolineales bacterium]
MGTGVKTMEDRSSTLKVYTLGLIPYEAGRKLQEQLAQAVSKDQEPAVLLLLEHPHTYTFGRRGDERNLLWDSGQLDTRGVEVHWIDRGGDVTYHGPGQLVGYPIFALGQVNAAGHLPQVDYVGYIRRLEEVIIRALADLGLIAGQIPDLTGVWVQPDVASRCRHCPPASRKQPSKIASIGVKVDVHGVSRHGFALNVNPEMSYWEGIIACGLSDYPAISLADLFETPPSMAQVRSAIIRAFQNVFHFSHVSIGELDLASSENWNGSV